MLTNPRTVDWSEPTYADLGLRSSLSFTGIPCVGDTYTDRGYSYRFVYFDKKHQRGDLVTICHRRPFLWLPNPRTR